MQDFKKLRVWHLAQEVSVEVIEALPERAVRRVPGLRSQAVRAANSIAANVAEGCARPSRGDLLRFVGVALASANELEAHLRLANRANVISTEIFLKLEQRINLVRRMLISLMRALEHQIAADEHHGRQTTAQHPDMPRT